MRAETDMPHHCDNSTGCCKRLGSRRFVRAMLSLALAAPLASAQSDAPPGFDPDAPPPAGREEIPTVEVGPRTGETEQDPAEQEVRIFRRDGEEVTEFRHGGVLRAVKVTPAVGPTYYLVDTDGDGDLETRTRELHESLAIPMWIILRW